MELTTFSMVLRFTLQLEDQTNRFYRSLVESNRFPQSSDLLTRFAENSDKRKKDLERTARESVDHSLLEPISEFFEETYSVTSTSAQGMGHSEALAAAKQMERTMERFYSEAGEKIGFLSNVSRVYKRYSQERGKAFKSLEEIL